MVSDLLLYKAEFIKDIDNKIAQSIKNIDNSDGLCIKLTDLFKQVHNYFGWKNPFFMQVACLQMILKKCFSNLQNNIAHKALIRTACVKCRLQTTCHIVLFTPRKGEHDNNNPIVCWSWKQQSMVSTQSSLDTAAISITELGWGKDFFIT